MNKHHISVVLTLDLFCPQVSKSGVRDGDYLKTHAKNEEISAIF